MSAVSTRTVSSRPASQNLMPWLIPAAAAVFVLACGIVLAAGTVASLLGGQGVPGVAVRRLPHVLAGWAQHPDDPRLAWPDPTQEPGPVGCYAALAFVLVVIVAAGFAIGLLWARRRRPGHRVNFRSGAWARPRDVAEMVVAKGEAVAGRIVLGFLVGKMVAALREHSVLIAGATRSGKTTGLVIPVVIEWPGAAVVCSSKTDVVNLTLLHAIETGEAWVFDPTGAVDPDGVLGIETHGFDPLAFCHTFRGALRTMDAFTDSSGAINDETGAAAYWKDHANSVGAAVLYAAALDGQDMGTVARWFKLAAGPLEDGGYFRDAVRILIAAAGKDVDNPDDPDAQTAVESLQFVMRMEVRQRDSAIGTCRVCFSIYDDPGVAASARSAQIDPSTFLDGRRRRLYLVAGRQEQKRLAPLFTALLTFIERELTDRAARNRARYGAALRDESERVLFVLDEVTKLAPLRQLPDLASEIGGEGGALLTVVQDFAQLDTHYRQAARSLISNHVVRMVAASVGDEGTLRYASKIAGNEQVDEQGSSASEGRRTTSTNPRVRAVIDEGQLRSLPEMTALAVYGNRPPMHVRLRPYFRDPVLSKAVRPLSTLLDRPTTPAVPLERVADAPTPVAAPLAPPPPVVKPQPKPEPVGAYPKRPREQESDTRCECNCWGFRHEGAKHRGRCRGCDDCEAFRPAGTVTPVPVPSKPLPTAEEIRLALSEGRAELTGTKPGAPLYVDGEFYSVGDGGVVTLHDDPAYRFALERGLNRMRVAQAAGAVAAGNVERVGTDPTMPFRFAGRWYVPTDRGPEPITDADQVAACEEGLARLGGVPMQKGEGQ